MESYSMSAEEPTTWPRSASIGRRNLHTGSKGNGGNFGHKVNMLE